MLILMNNGRDRELKRFFFEKREVFQVVDSPDRVTEALRTVETIDYSDVQADFLKYDDQEHIKTP